MTHGDIEKAIRQECRAYCHRRNRIKTMSEGSVATAYILLNKMIFDACKHIEDKNVQIYAPEFCEAMIEDIAYCRGYGNSKMSKYMSIGTYKVKKKCVKEAIASLFGWEAK